MPKTIDEILMWLRRLTTYGEDEYGYNCETEYLEDVAEATSQLISLLLEGDDAPKKRTTLDESNPKHGLPGQDCCSCAYNQAIQDYHNFIKRMGELAL